MATFFRTNAFEHGSLGRHAVGDDCKTVRPHAGHNAIQGDIVVGSSFLQKKTPIEHAFAIEVPGLGAAGSGRQERQGPLRHLVP